MMRNPMHLVFLSALACATSPVAPTAVAHDPAPAGAAIPLRDARERFIEAAALCGADHGVTWGRTLCGPMMVVDPASRAVVANQADAEHRLVARDGVFVGVLPGGENIANTSVSWAGVRWIQLRWDGWTLTLAPGWRLEPDERPGDLRLGCSRAVPPGGSAPATSACPTAAP